MRTAVSPKTRAVDEPEAVVIVCGDNDLTDDMILQLLDVEFRKRVSKLTLS
jgi:hypothetical protein